MTAEGVGYVWQAIADHSADAQKGRLKSLQTAKAEFVGLLPEKIRACERRAVFLREDMESILTGLQSGMPLDSYIRLVKTVANSLAKGRKELEWDTPIPAIPSKIPREPARFTPKLFKGVVTLRKLEQAVISAPRSDKPEVELGRMLLSVIIFGGMTSSKWVNMWVNGFNKIAAAEDGFDMSPVKWYGDSLSLETFEEVFATEDGKDDEGKGHDREAVYLYRRWFADPVSAALLCRWLSDRANFGIRVPAGRMQWYRCIRKFLKTARLGDDLAKNATELLQMAETALSLKVSPFLAAYSACDITSASLPEAVWARLVSGSPVRNVAKRPETAAADGLDGQSVKYCVKSIMTAAGENVVPSVQLGFLCRIKKLFYKGKRVRINSESSKIIGEIQAIVDSQPLCQIVRLLAMWAMKLLSKGGKTVPSSVRRYLGAIGHYLTTLCCQDDFINLDPSEFYEVYEQVIDLVESESEKEVVRGVLGRFHLYLMDEFKLQGVEGNLFASRKGPAEFGVDANLITCAEFDRVKAALGANNPDRMPVATASILIAVLGFRCGLRRNEILYLKNSDINGESIYELVLKPNRLRGLKSRRSRRRFLLNTLLLPDELEMLIDWWGTRLVAANSDGLLFAPPTRCNHPYTDAEVFTPITMAMHLVTGDETLRFHHMRHSFANWLLLRLCGSGVGMRARAPFLDHPEFDDARIAELRVGILENEAQGRKAAYVVAQLCGHAGPSMTFGSYIHLIDWLFGQELCAPEAQPAVTAKAFAPLAGVPYASAYRCLTRYGEDGLRRLALAAIKLAGLKLYKAPALKKQPVNNLIKYSEEASLEFRWVTVMRVFKHYLVECQEISSVAYDNRVNLDVVRGWIAERNRIAWIKSGRQRLRVLHRKPMKDLVFKGYYVDSEVWRHKDAYYNEDGYIVQPDNSGRKQRRLKDGRSKGKVRAHSGSAHPKWFPVEPSTLKEFESLRSMMVCFEKLPKDERARLVEFSEYFCQNFNPESNCIWHRSTDTALKHLEALGRLGVTKSRTALIDIRTAGEANEVMRKSRSDWELRLGLKNANWIADKMRKSFRRHGSAVGVKVLQESGGKSSYAARYAMYLIRIAYADEFDVPDTSVFQ